MHCGKKIYDLAGAVSVRFVRRRSPGSSGAERSSETPREDLWSPGVDHDKYILLYFFDHSWLLRAVARELWHVSYCWTNTGKGFGERISRAPREALFSVRVEDPLWGLQEEGQVCLGLLLFCFAGMGGEALCCTWESLSLSCFFSSVLDVLESNLFCHSCQEVHHIFLYFAFFYSTSCHFICMCVCVCSLCFPFWSSLLPYHYSPSLPSPPSSYPSISLSIYRPDVPSLASFPSRYSSIPPSYRLTVPAIPPCIPILHPSILHLSSIAVVPQYPLIPPSLYPLTIPLVPASPPPSLALPGVGQ